METLPENLPSTLSPEDYDAIRNHLVRANMEEVFAGTKSKKMRFTEAMLKMSSPQWWDEVNRLAYSNPAPDDKAANDLKKVALQEINKVQLRHIDTTVKHDVSDLIVNIINYRDQEPAQPTKQAEVIIDKKNGDSDTTSVPSEGISEEVSGCTAEIQDFGAPSSSR